MKKSKIPVFTPEQLDYLLALQPEGNVGLGSSKDEFLYEHFKRSFRKTIKHIAEGQGYAI